MLRNVLRFVILFFALIVACPCNATLPEYKIRQLDELDGVESGAYSINNNGFIAGYITHSDDQPHAVVWNPDGSVRFIISDVIGYGWYGWSKARVITDSGLVGAGNVPFIWNLNGQIIHMLQPLLPDYYFGVLGMNNAGDAVSWLVYEIIDGYGHNHAAFWKEKEQDFQWFPVDLGALDTDMQSKATSINESGFIIGISQHNIYSDIESGVVWNPYGQIKQLETLGGTHTIPYDINNSGQIVGYSGLYTKGIIWDTNGNIVQETEEPAVYYGINDKGQIIGSSSGLVGLGYGQFIQDTDGTRTELKPLHEDDDYVYPIDINNNTIVVGRIRDKRFNTHAVIWEPIQEPTPDISITKTATPDPVIVGGDITYTIQIKNNGPGKAENVVVTDNLPSEISFVSCSATGGGVCTGTGNNRTVTFASVPEGTSETITIIAKVNDSVADGTQITNTATVNDKSATVSVQAVKPPQIPDVSITKSAYPNTAITGNNLTYTIYVRNNGPGEADNVTVVDNLPDEVRFLSCSATGGGICGGTNNNRTVTFASIPEGTTETITIRTNVKSTVPNVTPITNTATANLAQDINPANNSATTTVYAAKTYYGLQARIALVDGNPTPLPGTTGSWTYRITLLAVNTYAFGVEIRSSLSDWGKITSIRPSAGKVTIYPSPIWRVTSIPAGHAETLLVTVTGKVPDKYFSRQIALSGSWYGTYYADGLKQSIGPVPPVILNIARL